MGFARRLTLAAIVASALFNASFLLHSTRMSVWHTGRDASSASREAERSLGLLVPFVDEQRDELFEMVRRWTAMPPCASRPLPATLFLYHPSNTSIGSPAEWDLFLHALGESARCFRGGVKLLEARLPEEIASRHPDGTCEQFYAAFSLLRGRVDYFFLMEPDALPIRRGWLDALVAEVQLPPCEAFWVRGSVAHCDAAYGELRARHDLHVNGGALYCVGGPSDGFARLRDGVRSFYPPFFEAAVQTAGCAHGGFDHALYQYLHHKSNFDYARTVLHLYQYTDSLYNMCEEAYDEEALRQALPAVQVVHSKWPRFDEAERQVRQIYWNVLGRFPIKRTEQKAWAEKVRSASVVRLSQGDTLEAEPEDGEAELQAGPTLNTMAPDPIEEVRRAAAAAQRARARALGSLVENLCCSWQYLSRLEAHKPSEQCTSRCADSAALRRRCPRTCAPAAARLAWGKRLGARPYVWSADFHSGPIGCTEPLLLQLGARIHAEVDFNNCVWHPHTCKRRLKVLAFDEWRGFSLDPCPNALRRAFFEAYRNDEELRRVDLFVCSHPAANCELFLPFDRRMLVYATTRLEFGRNDRFVSWRVPYIGRHSPRRWEEWIRSLRAIAARPGNVVAANNMFDVHYISYHANISALYLPSWCENTASYTPNMSLPYLLGPYRDNLGGELVNGSDVTAWAHPLLQQLSRTLASTPYRFRRMREAYGSAYKWSDIVQHPALVYIPYQVSTVSFFEFYRANIPLFVPSVSLLLSWVTEFNLLWERVYGTPERLHYSAINGFAGSSEPESPNDNRSLSYWLGLCDYYSFPHVMYFDSWDELVSQLGNESHLRAVSERMAAFNLEQRAKLAEQWSVILDGTRSEERSSLAPSSDFDQSMRSLWGTQGPLPPDPGWKCKLRNLRTLEARWATAEIRPEGSPGEVVHPPFLLPGQYMRRSGMLSSNNAFELNIVPDPALHAVLCVGPPRHKPHQHPASLLNTRDGRLCLYGTDVPPLSSGTAAVSTDGLSLPAESADAMSNRTNPELWCFPTCLHCALFIEDNGAVLVRNGSHLRRVIQGARGRKICHDPTGQ